MAKKKFRTRTGIVSDSCFNATASIGHYAAITIHSNPSLLFDLRNSSTLTLQLEAGGEPFSTLFATVGSFSSFSEPFWGTLAIGGIHPDNIIIAYDHDVTPVRYIRLDDVLLVYAGDVLTQVVKESGDKLILVYDGTQLTRVTNEHLGITKEFKYTDNKLTNVTTTSTN